MHFTFKFFDLLQEANLLFFFSRIIVSTHISKDIFQFIHVGDILIEPISILSSHLHEISKDDWIGSKACWLNVDTKMFASHLCKDLIEVGLVFIVDKTVMEDTLALMAEKTEDAVLISDDTRVSLQDT